MELLKVEVSKKAYEYGGDYRDRRAVLYFDVKDETIMENLVERHYRPVDMYRSFIPEIMKKVNEQLIALGMLSLENRKIRFTWSRKAGCSCPCSPGFLISEKCETLGVSSPLNGFVVWATVGKLSPVSIA